MATELSVNVNKVALLRNQRELGIPSVVGFARAALDAGAKGITVHPRPDRRHIRPGDVDDLAELLVDPAYEGRELNVEGNPLEAGGNAGHLMAILRRVKPDQVTLVPDAAGQSTSDHGFDLELQGELLRPIVSELQEMGCRVSVFMDAEPEAMVGVSAIGADRVELYTEPYASVYGLLGQPGVLERFVACATRCKELGLAVNAGHDLSLANLGTLLGAVRGEGRTEISEVSIGHALVAEALHLGVHRVVLGYLAICRGAER